VIARRLKFVSSITAGQAPPSDLVTDSGSLPFLQGCAEFGDKSPTPTKYCDAAPKIADCGTWLISVRAPVGELNFADRDYGIGRGLAGIKAGTIDPDYLGYVLRNGVQQLRSRSTGSTYEGISTSQLGELLIPSPDIRTQRAVADFLDHETARIEQLIAKKERLNLMIRQKQQALMDQLITGGLSTNHHRKPVSVPWLSDVPSHWSVLPVKRVLASPITDGPHETPEFVDDGVMFISAESIQNGEIDFDRRRGNITTEANLFYSRKYSPISGDIYIVKSGATTGKSAMVRDFTDFNIWSPLAVLRPAESISGDYLLLVVRSSPFQRAIALNWSWGTQQNIGMGDLERIAIPVPPREEQEWIAQHYANKTRSISETITRNSKSIGLLREYRSSLITAAVTGQIDVTTWRRRGHTERQLEAAARAEDIAHSGSGPDA
jgi:type I restriction enzyme S subunit